MSVNYKAQIAIGYELTANWNKIIDEDFFEEYVDNFLTASVYQDGFALFGVIVDEVDEGCFVEYNADLSLNGLTLLREFADKYPEAIANPNQFSSKYLICKEC
jgi:hypothetical protein